MSTNNSQLKKNILKILEKTRVNFLFGAGASYVPNNNGLSFPLMKDLVEEILRNQEYIDYISSCNIDVIKSCHNEFLVKKGNVEDFLSSIEGLVNYPSELEFVDVAIYTTKMVKEIILSRIMRSDKLEVIDLFKVFYKEIIDLTREKEESFKRINIFTTNYDMINEIALESQRIHYYSGFFGIESRSFEPSHYNFTYSDNMNLKTHNYIVKSDHINLYKLHGSLSWRMNNNKLVEISLHEKDNGEPVIIYPSHTKFNQTSLISYYSTLMREFNNSLTSKQSTLVVIGYSFSDEHINRIIESALSIETFTLIALLYSNEDVKRMKESVGERSNTIIINGSDASLSGFVNRILKGRNESD